MEHVMKAKMKVHSVTATEYGETFKANPVCGKLGPEGDSEDNTYAKFTPSGELSLTVNNPALLGEIKAGQTFYVYFVRAETV